VTAAARAVPVLQVIPDQKVSPGVLGFLVVAAIGVATWLLIRSMNRQLHKISFSEDAIDRERNLPSVPEPETAAQVDGPQADDSARNAAQSDDGPGVAGDRLPE
jgi:hypothetical protein